MIQPDKAVRKSLFSFQVDDVVIQRVFKTLEEDVKRLTNEVKELKEEMKSCAQKSDLDLLSNSVTEFMSNSTDKINKFEERQKEFNENISSNVSSVKSFVNDEISEAVFSVNNVVRAQNTMIEEKIFQISRPTVEFEQLQRDVFKIKDKNKRMTATTDKITDFFQIFLGDENQGKPLTLDQFVDKSLIEIRDQVSNLENMQIKNEERFMRSDYVFKKVFGNTDEIIFPRYGKAEKVVISEKPKIPILKDPNTIFDYLSYMMNMAPSIQRIFSAFYHQICTLSNSIYDREEKEVSLEHLHDRISLLDQIETDLTHLKSQIADKEQLDLISSMYEEFKDKSSEKSEIDRLNRLILNMREEYVPKEELDQKMYEIKNDIDKVVSNALTEIRETELYLQEQYPQQDSFRALTREDDYSLPAIAAVTPRGNVSHKMMYKQTPSTTRVVVPKKEEIEENSKHTRRQKNAPRVNLPLDSIHQTVSSRSALASSKRRLD